jgi:hypothetical protein
MATQILFSPDTASSDKTVESSGLLRPIIRVSLALSLDAISGIYLACVYGCVDIDIDNRQQVNLPIALHNLPDAGANVANESRDPKCASQYRNVAAVAAVATTILVEPRSQRMTL